MKYIHDDKVLFIQYQKISIFFQNKSLGVEGFGQERVGMRI